MIELIQITNDPDFARHCDEMGGFRVMIDLERLGKAERQAGRNTFISQHQASEIAPVKAVLRRTRLMVRVNPLNDGTRAEVDHALAHGADLLMLPMFGSPDELAAFCAIVARRAPVVPLLETRDALLSVHRWIIQPGLGEVFMGLNDLHISLGCAFMFEPLAWGIVDEVALAAARQGLPFGFGGIARMDEGLLPGRDVLAEHLRMGSGSVILSRAFHRADGGTSFDADVAALRRAESDLALRTAAQADADRARIASCIRDIARGMASPPPASR